MYYVPKKGNVLSFLRKTGCIENRQRRKDLFNTERRFLQLSSHVHAYTRAWKIHRREPARTVPITRNKCELIKGRKQLLANKSPPLIRYSADKLNFSSRRQFSRAREHALTGALREIGICETDVDVGARSHNWLWALPPASQSRSRTAGGGAKRRNGSFDSLRFKMSSSLQIYLALCFLN